MNVVKCPNTHFYDSDTYEACPVCGCQAENTQQNASNEKSSKKGFFSKFKKKNSSSSESITSHTVTGGVSTISSSPEQTPSSDTPAKESFQDAVSFSDALTVPMSAVTDDTAEETSDNTTEADSAVQSQPESIPETPVQESVQNEPAESQDTYKSSTITAEPIPSAREAAPSSSSSLSDAVRKASANSEGKTASYFSAITSGNSASPARENVTVQTETERPSSSGQNLSTEPVVGWIVCTDGPHTGISFCLAAGKNTVGRSSSNHIVLSADNAVSREKHATFVYEPKKRNFFIQPGDSSGLTYLNDEYITESCMLKNRDIVEIGNTKLLFVPLCDETFSWEDCINREK